jgi:hypothetical protein
LEGGTIRRAVCALGLAVCGASPGSAQASAYDVEARTEDQVYSLRRFTNDPGAFEILTRRRLVQYLDVAGFELVSGEDVGVDLVLRFDADFGVTAAEAAGIDSQFRDRLQLLTGRVHWNHLAGDRVDLALGRITGLDAMSWFAFDGGKVTYRPHSFVALTAYGGLLVQGASWLGSGTWAPDGVRDSDERRLRAGYPTVPCPQAANRLCADPTLTDPAPTFGAKAAASWPGRWGGAELGWRRTLRGGGIIEERVAASAHQALGPVRLDAAVDYDLYLLRLAAARASARWAPTGFLSVTAEAARWHPSFSADSIWNLFDTAPTDDLRLRADWALPAAAWRFYASAGVVHYETSARSEQLFADKGGNAPAAALGASFSEGPTSLFGDASWRGGLEGTQAWLTATARRAILPWLSADARATYARIQDPNVSSYNGSFVSLAAGLSGRFERRTQLSVLLEDSTGPFTASDLRAYAFLTIGADWDSRRP